MQNFAVHIVKLFARIKQNEINIYKQSFFFRSNLLNRLMDVNGTNLCVAYIDI